MCTEDYGLCRSLQEPEPEIAGRYDIHAIPGSSTGIPLRQDKETSVDINIGNRGVIILKAVAVLVKQHVALQRAVLLRKLLFQNNHTNKVSCGGASSDTSSFVVPYRVFISTGFNPSPQVSRNATLLRNVLFRQSSPLAQCPRRTSITSRIAFKRPTIRSNWLWSFTSIIILILAVTSFIEVQFMLIIDTFSSAIALEISPRR